MSLVSFVVGDPMLLGIAGSLAATVVSVVCAAKEDE